MRISGDQIGIGLREPHYHQVLKEKPKIDWFEVHTENFMIHGGPLHDILFSIRELYPISFHGVGLSLGSAQGICKNHLKRIKKLINQFEPVLLSEHLTWSNTGRFYLPDLLPIPYNEENLMAVVNNIDAAQNYLQRTLLIENPSSYFEYRTSCYSEAEFLAELVKRTGMHILLDVNNLYISCFNHNWEPYQYIQTLPQKAIKEIHVAGHSVHIQDSNHMLLDTHDNYVCQEVWDLYRYVIRYIGVVPTLMEWDREIPALDILLNEAKKSANYVNDETNTE